MPNVALSSVELMDFDGKIPWTDIFFWISEVSCSASVSISIRIKNWPESEKQLIADLYYNSFSGRKRLPIKVVKFCWCKYNKLKKGNFNMWKLGVKHTDVSDASPSSE